VLFQIIIPLYGEQILFSVIALLASRYKVPLCALTPSDDRDDMIHCERVRKEALPTVVTKPLSDTNAPPTAFSEFASFILFLPYLLIGYFSNKIVQY